MANAQDDCDVTYKVLLLGDSGVGKTSLIRSLTGSEFSHDMLTTVGIDFVKVKFNVDGANVRLQIWDTAGQERFRSITRFQYRKTKGLLLLYDITNRQSYKTLSYWMKSIEKDIDEEEPIPIIIVGNKSDLETSRTVSTLEGRQVSEKNFLAGFWETSAATGANVRECFQALAHAVTEVNNPGLMGLYKLSTSPPRPSRVETPASSPTAVSPSKRKRTSTIRLSKSRKQSKCQCNS